MKTDVLIRIGGLPWSESKVLTDIDSANIGKIAKDAEIDWIVNAEALTAPLHGVVPGYWLVYREDTFDALGVVVRGSIRQTQNSEAFCEISTMLADKNATFITAGALSESTVFGVIKLNKLYHVDQYDIDHYMVIINDHLKPDGCVTVLNVPVLRELGCVVSSAISANLYKTRVSAAIDPGACRDIAFRLITNAENCLHYLESKIRKLRECKIDDELFITLIEKLFPCPDSALIEAGINSAIRQQEKTQMLKTTFVEECLDPLVKQDGCKNAWNVFLALAEYTQHWFAKLENGYSIVHRMKVLPGISADSTSAIIDQFFKFIDTQPK